MDEDISLEDMWLQAENRFAKITSKSLKTAPKKSLNAVFAELETRYSDKEPEVVESRTKEWMRNVLSCINLLGGIAAEGVSMVC
jgi:hypothetical protein